MGIGTLKLFDPSFEEFLTEILDEPKWWLALDVVVDRLRAKGVSQVDAEFGWILDRDEDGLFRGVDQSVGIDSLVEFVRKGLSDGVIERVGTSDFVFRVDDPEFVCMLCNDADVHFASKDRSFLLEIANELKRRGISVWNDGNPV